MGKNVFPSPCVEWNPNTMLSQLNPVVFPWKDVLRLSLVDVPVMELERIHGAIFSGIPGNGRYAMAEALAGSLRQLGYERYLRISGCGMDCEDVGDVCSVLNEVSDVIRRGGRLCLLLDAPEQSGHSLAIQEYLLQMMDHYGDELFLILVTDDPDRVCSGLQRRLPVFPCVTPTLERRQDWLNQVLVAPVAIKFDGMDIWGLARETDGFTWQQLHNLWKHMRRKIVAKYTADIGRYNPERDPDEDEVILSQGRVHLSKTEIMTMIQNMRSQKPAGSSAQMQFQFMSAQPPSPMAALSGAKSAPAKIDDEQTARRVQSKHGEPEKLSFDEFTDIDDL